MSLGKKERLAVLDDSSISALDLDEHIIDPPKKSLGRGIVLTLLGGALWGLNGTLSKWLFDAYQIDPLWLAWFREITACWFFFLTAALFQRDALVQAAKSGHAWLSFTLIAIGSILFSQVSYLVCIDWTNSATATVLQSLGVVLVMIFVCVRSRRKPRKRELLGLVFACVGTFLIATGGDPHSLVLPLPGLLWGFMCAAAAAMLAIQPLSAIEKWGNFVVNGFAFLIAAILLSITGLPFQQLPSLDVAGWFYLILAVILGTFGAYAFYLQGVKEVGSIKGSMLSSSEPLVAVISTVLITGVSFSLPELVGIVLILAVIFLTA